MSLLALAASTLAATTFGTTAAHAAPGDPFDPADPTVFIAQNVPTQLFTARTSGTGDITFTAEGAPSDIQYNAIAYRTADNYLYGIANTASATIPANSLIRIGQDGAITRVGTATYAPSVIGSFGPADGYYYTYAAVAGVNSLQVINVATGAVVRTTPVTGDPLPGVDFAYANGYFWQLGGGFISRTDPATGATVRWTAPFENPVADVAGAGWTFGNGNLGFLYNGGAGVYQIAVANAASATPTFTLVSTNPGPGSGNNDGASSPGLPTDFSIVKDGPESFPSTGGTITYTVTATNTGPGNSSGFVVNDTIPAPLTGATTASPGCSVDGDEVTCLGGRLVAGDSVTYTITATVPAGSTAAIANTATVTSNEQDPAPGNNTSTHTALPASISLVKRAGAPADVNGNGITDAGDTIQYTFDVINSGQVPLTGVTVDDPKAGIVTCPTTTLDAGATVTCSTDTPYVITDADVDAGAVENSATATGTTPDGVEVASPASTTSTPTEAPAPGISVVKSADPVGGALEAGEVITYTFVVTNTGNVPLDDVAVVEGAFTGTGELSEISCPETSLAPDTQQLCTATYTLTAEDVDAGSVTNSAIAEGTPTGSTTPISSTPSQVTVPAEAEPGVSVLKSADLDTIVEAGQTVTYSFRVTNTGNVTLTDVAVVEGAFSGTGELSAVDCPTTTLAAGQFTTCTATYTVTQADVDAGGELTNTATVTATPPTGDPIPSEPSTSTVTIDQSPDLALAKTADVQAAEVGQVVTYSFVVTNTGNVTVTDPAVEEGEFSGTGELSELDCPTGAPLAPGDSLTCTATYTVTQADVDAGEIRNTATVTGTTPGGDPVPSTPSTAIVATDPLPALAVAKTADVETVTHAGQTVTYSFVVTNVGNVTISAPVVEEGEFSGAGELSAVTCPDDAVLAPGDSVTCTATYTVVAADLTANELTNTATVTGTTPNGDPITSAPSTATTTVTPAVTPGATPPGATPPGGGLAATGAALVGPGVGIALALMVLGGVALFLRRKRGGQQENLS